MHDNNRYTYEARSRVPRTFPVKKGVSPAIVVLSVILVFGLCVGGGFLGAKLAVGESDGGTTNTTVIYVDSTDRATKVNADGGEMTAPEVVLAVRDSVAEIHTGSVQDGAGGYVKTGAGSGVVMTDNGHILTAYHVVAGAEAVDVKLSDGATYRAEWVRGDEITDIAVVKIDARTLNSANKGDSSVLDQGQSVIAIGNPTGSLGGSVSGGMISGLNRSTTVDGKEMDNLIQTNIVVASGCSGGGLFNMYGALVGIINAKGSDGVGFAIPSETAYKVGIDLIECGYVKGRVDLDAIELYEISSSDTKLCGLYVGKISSDAPRALQTLGLKQNDYIVSAGGVDVHTIEEWNAVLNIHAVGEKIDVEYMRDNTLHTVSMLITQRTDCDK